MKKIFTLAAVALIATSAWAEDQVFVLDLNNPTVPESFTFNNDVWSEVYNESISYIECPPFLISHLYNASSYGGYYWDGFVVSKKTENADHSIDGWVENSFSSVPGGGVEASEPYLVGYWANWDGDDARACHIAFDDGMFYRVDGVYVTNSTWPYYEGKNGGSNSRPFNQEGDYFKLIAHGVHADKSESTAEIELMGCHNGQFSAIEDWQWWDLSALGRVEKIYFTLTSTDTGDYGMNTAAYFCLSRLTVKNPNATAIESVDASKQVASVKYVNLAGVESATPFQGMNIEVKTYTDGTRSTSKVLR